MKVLLTTISLDARKGGGTAERTRRLADHLQRVGAQCSVAVMQDGNLADELRSIGIPVYASGQIRLRFAFPLINPLRLANLVRECDVIHILGYWNILSVLTAAFARVFGKPYVFSAAGEFVGLDSPRPIALLFHRLFGRRMLTRAARLIAITELEQRQILDRFGGTPESVLVVPNGVYDEPRSRQADFAPPAGPYVLFVGRLAPVKGPDLLIAAFARIAHRHPGVRLVMAGPDFGLLRDLKMAVATAHLDDRVTFTGHVDEGQKEVLYRNALFLVVPSRSEAMSLVALEAGILGTPVLLTDQCGFDDIEAIGGGLVVPASVEGIMAGLEGLLTQRETLAEKGKLLKDFVTGTFAWPVIAGLLRDRLQAVTAGVACDTDGASNVQASPRERETGKGSR